MKHTGRKKLGILLLLIMCFSVFPINAFAREDTAADRESGKRTAESAGHLLTGPAGLPVTDIPVISFHADTLTVRAAGSGTVILCIDGVKVDNPYAFSRGDGETSHTVTATALESGKRVSETVTLEVIVPAGTTVGLPASAVTYTDGAADAEIFPDQVYTAANGEPTPGFIGDLSRPGYTFQGWSPAVAPTVTGDATYAAVWRKSGIEEDLCIPSSYPVRVMDGEHGTVEADCEEAIPNSCVNLTVTPEKGFMLAELNILCGSRRIKAAGKNGSFRFFMPDGPAAVIAVFQAIIPYTDVHTDDWFYADVLQVTAEDLMNGTGNGEFSPEGTTDRAMLVTVLWRQNGSPRMDSLPNFSDVASGRWYSNAIAWAAANGIVKGCGNGLFRPSDPITREQIAAILNRYAAYKGWTDEAAPPVHLQHKCSKWAEDNVSWAFRNGLLEGLGVDISDMTARASRAELAAYLRRFLQISGR